MPYVTRDPIEIAEWHACAIDSRDGASVEFAGIVRGTENGIPVASLDYEAYEPMADCLIAQCIEEAKTRWALHQVYIRHRVGRVAVGEVAVLIGVQAPHREDAFEACRFLIDAIKRDAPIWKMAYDAHEDVVERCDVDKDRCH